MEFDFDLDRLVHVRRHLQSVVHGLAGSRWQLVIVQRHEDILRVAAIDPAALAVEHERIHKMCPGIDLAVGVQAAAMGQLPPAAGDRDFQPDFIRVNRALGEMVSQFQGAQHDLQQVFSARLERRQFGTQRRDQRAVNRPTLAQSKDIDAHTIARNCW